jgi:hypothetical protein
MPDAASPPEKLTASGRLYQPPESAVRAGEAVTSGAVASYLNPKSVAALWLPARSRQVPLSEALALSGVE